MIGPCCCCAVVGICCCYNAQPTGQPVESHTGCVTPGLCLLGSKAAFVAHHVRQNDACPVLCVWSLSVAAPSAPALLRRGGWRGSLGCVRGVVCVLVFHMCWCFSCCCRPPMCLQGRLGGACLCDLLECVAVARPLFEGTRTVPYCARSWMNACSLSRFDASVGLCGAD